MQFSIGYFDFKCYGRCKCTLIREFVNYIQVEDLLANTKTRFNDVILNTVYDYTSKAFSLMIYWIKSDI